MDYHDYKLTNKVMETIKIDEKTIEVTKTIPQEIIPVKTEIKQYKIDFLKEQKIRVEADLKSVVTRHAKELEVAQESVNEVNTLILEAGKLGIIAKEEK